MPFTYPGLGAPHSLCYQNCSHNVVDALVRRHYNPGFPTLQQPAVVEQALALLKRILRANGLGPGALGCWDDDEVVRTRVAHKRRAYADAFASLGDTPVSAHDAKVMAFIKFEKMPDDTRHKPARLIQYRSTRYTAALARYLAPIEHALYKVKWRDTALFAKSLDWAQRAEGIADALMPGCKYAMFDHSSFDGHVTEQWLRYEHRVYQWLFPKSQDLRRLLEWQLYNKCKSRTGVGYTVRGGRVSGDFNTALGNCVVNCLVMLSWAIQQGLADDARFVVQCDGDDSWCRVPSDHVVNCSGFRDLGWTTKVEGEAFFPEGVGFCQARPVRLVDGWCMVRNPDRVLARLPYTIQDYVGSGWRRYLKGVAMCETALSTGVPILWAIAAGLSGAARSSQPLFPREPEYANQYQLLKSPPRRALITSDVRASFAAAWGFSPTQQVEMESALLRHSWWANCDAGSKG